MEPQILKTTAGEELVVLPRRDDDVLLARLGDEEAEDRLLADIARKTLEDLKSCREILLPVWFSERMMIDRNPIRAVREHFCWTLEETARRACTGPDALGAIERGEAVPTATMLDAISTHTDLDPRILKGMYDL